MTQETSEPVRMYVPPSRAKKLVGGSFIFLCGVFIAWVTWSQAMSKGEFSFKGALIGPAFAVLGLGVALLPGYREERLARGEDLSQLDGWRLITPRWWAVLATGLALGGAWAWFLAHGSIDVLPLPVWR